MKRREVLKMGAAAAAAPALSRAAAKAKTRPVLFTAEQYDTVVSLTDAIIPGAKEAEVARYMDLILHDGPATERDRFLTGLQWLNEYAVRTNRAPFLKLTPEQQVAILEVLDKGGPDVEEGHRFFRMAKSMTSQFYYSTAAGYRELNKGVRIPAPGKFGCQA
ncbi:MAG TPA: gluconate 2-dehydrogenase subunit 3 family protein [Bryobacteraceae bacterium]|nr:gluconate 2-dehydrogenase subunit 3 family protein [Bryobacteraceae bacterium]